METNELSKNANGGTEQMLNRLHSTFDAAYLQNFQIIPSRVRDLDLTKRRIYWAHDLAGDPEAQKALGGNNWQRFHHIVFVSHWQRMEYIRQYPNIPWSRTSVLKNAIEPILSERPDRDSTIIKLVYHTTPHRGLRILVPIFEQLNKEFENKLQLDLYSSFKAYGWEARDEEFQDVWERVQNNENIKSFGYQPNDVIREALLSADIFAYPNIWPETSCIALMEAMAAGCICIHPDFAALPETAANWTAMYGYHEELKDHVRTFYNVLKTGIEYCLNRSEDMETQLRLQRGYANQFYNWNRRALEWSGLLEFVLHQPLEIQNPEEMIVLRGS